MILISNQEIDKIKLPDTIQSKSIIILDIIKLSKSSSKKINNELIKYELYEILTGSKYDYQLSEKVFLIKNSSNIDVTLITYLFNGDSRNNVIGYKDNFRNLPDVYFFDVSQSQYNLLMSKFKNLFKLYNFNHDLYKNETLKYAEMIITLDKNRCKLIRYDKITFPLSYLLKLMSYNSFNTNNTNSIISNCDLIINLNKYLYHIEEECIQNMINISFNPLRLFRIDFPPKQKEEEKSPEKIEIKKLSIEDAKSKVSTEFIEKVYEINNTNEKESLF